MAALAKPLCTGLLLLSSSLMSASAFLHPAGLDAGSFVRRGVVSLDKCSPLPLRPRALSLAAARDSCKVLRPTPMNVEMHQMQRHDGVRGRVMKVSKKAVEMVKKVGLSGMIVLTALLLTAGNPLVASATTLADMSMSATSAFNGVTASLAASGFLQAFSLVFVSEIGDKTFFIAGLLAMKTSRLISFTGSMAALTVMTVISVVIGQIFHAIPSSLAGGVKLDQWVAVLAFAYFGFKTLYDAYEMPDGDASGIEEEKAEAEKAVEGSKAAQAQKNVWSNILQIFSLVFAAEFGDRSFLSTIALGAAQNPLSVATGAIAAHGTATGIAVASGAFLSKYLSEKIIGYIGGSLFVLFAITTAIGIF